MAGGQQVRGHDAGEPRPLNFTNWAWASRLRFRLPTAKACTTCLISCSRNFPTDDAGDEETDKHPKIAVIGRPNVGKSTLVNTLAWRGARDCLRPAGHDARQHLCRIRTRRAGAYTLIDTAGVRRRGKVEDVAEKFSVIKTLQAIEDANVVVLVLDVTQDISDQDAHLAGFILEAGRALVVAINKWDAAGRGGARESNARLRAQAQFPGFCAACITSPPVPAAGCRRC